MSTVRPARKPPSRRRRSSEVAARRDAERHRFPHSLVFVGLSSLLLGVPLLVLGDATGPYDDPKAWALPILVSVTGLAWLVGMRGRIVAPLAVDDRAGRALGWVVVSYLAWWMITTATSIAPGQSLLGNFGRGLGLLSIASGAALFFLVRWECRSRQAVFALIDVALLGSVPVCLLALGQAFGWDTLPRAWDPAVATLKVRSTFGQHIFLGSYLVVLVPLALARLVAAVRARKDSVQAPATWAASLRLLSPGAVWILGALGLVVLVARWPAACWLVLPWSVAGAVSRAMSRDDSGARGRLDVALPGALLALQFLIVVLTRARGPLLGVLLGLAVATFLLLGRRRAWKALGLSVMALAALVLALVLINVTGSPLTALPKHTVFSRLGQLANTNPGTPVWFRLRVWDAITSAWRAQLQGHEVIPGTSPLVRSAIGYGLETQLVTLGQIALPALEGRGAHTAEWRARYVVDRAHNTLLDHLVTGGLVGAALWILLVASLVAVAAVRIRRSQTTEDMSLSAWTLAAVVAHVAEGQAGIVTPMPLALFWLAAGLLASGPWSGAPVQDDESPPPSSFRRRWIAAVLFGFVILVLVTWISTRWLLASVAYADGVHRVLAGRMDDARADFARSTARYPWLPVPAQAFASASLRVAAGERDPATRLRILQEGEAALLEARRHAMGDASSWMLSAQLALAEARAGERSKLAVSLSSFASAARFSPGEPALLAQWAWAWLESGDLGRARQTAEDAVARSSATSPWLAWAVLARAARELGDVEQAQRAADRARTLAPPEARRVLDSLLR